MTTAIINPAAETIQVRREHLPLMLQLKTVGAVASSPQTDLQVAELQAARVIAGSELHPMVDAMMEVVSSPGLIVSVERLRAGDVAAGTIWATRAAAVVGRHLGGDEYRFELTTPRSLFMEMLRLTALRPRPPSVPLNARVSAATLFQAERALHQSGSKQAARLLSEHGLDPDCATTLSEALGARVASWRVHSVWNEKGQRTYREASGVDCGERGHLLVDVADDILTIENSTFGGVTQRLRTCLPGQASSS